MKRPSAKTSSSAAALAKPRVVYGDLDDSDFVHDEIKEVGRQLKAHMERSAPTNERAILEHMRAFGGPSEQSKAQLRKELDGAMQAVESGLYVVYRNVSAGGSSSSSSSSVLVDPRRTKSSRDLPNECCRIGNEHRCFCNHSWAAHNVHHTTRKKNMGGSGSGGGELPACSQCQCKCFTYIPNMPEEVGDGFLSRRRGFDPGSWFPKCRCGHGSASHDPVSKKCFECRSGGCCFHFESHFACGVCDGKWEDHATVLESERERQQQHRPVGSEYLPLSEVDPEFRELVFGAETAARLPPGSGKRLPPAQQQQHQLDMNDINSPFVPKAQQQRLLQQQRQVRQQNANSVTEVTNDGDDDGAVVQPTRTSIPPPGSFSSTTRPLQQRGVPSAPTPQTQTQTQTQRQQHQSDNTSSVLQQSGQHATCPSCNTLNRRLAKFCRSCGTKIA